MLTIFKAASGSFTDQELATKDKDFGATRDYIFILSYMVICFILIMNLIVGQLASAYSRYVKKKNVLMLLETLSVSCLLVVTRHCSCDILVYAVLRFARVVFPDSRVGPDRPDLLVTRLIRISGFVER